jgi:hypothetical protein
MLGPVKAMFKQGLQDVTVIEEPGIFMKGLGRIRSFIYMDDMALVASSKEGLEILLKRYQRFCRTFRIALNPKKSAVMRFASDTPTHVSVQGEGGETISTPKNGVYKYLGFWLDSQLTGEIHAQRAMACGRGKLFTVASIAKRMGEDLAIWYVKAKVVPKMTFGLELAPAWRKTLAAKADKVLGDLIQEALMVGPISTWWEGSQPRVNKNTLHVEAGVMQISSIVEQRKLGLINNIAADTTTLAGSLFYAKSSGVGWPNMWLRETTNLSQSLLGTHWQTMGAKGTKAKDALKTKIKARMWQEQGARNLQALHLRQPTWYGRQSNAVNVEGMRTYAKPPFKQPTVVEQWKTWVPNFHNRVFLRRMKMGCIPGLKANRAKYGASRDPVSHMTFPEKL